MLKSTTSIFIGFAALGLLLNSSCKKTDDITSGQVLTRVKVYDDTLAEIRNSSINIASTNDRLYMTYGIGNSNAYDYVNTTVYLVSGSYAKLMALDNEGAVLWERLLPTNLVVDDILTFDNGSCLAVGFKKTYVSQVQYLHIIQFSKNGELSFADSVLFTLPNNVLEINSANVMHSVNGNLLFFGSYNDTNYSQQGYLCEYDLSLNPLWEISDSTTINGCALTPDGAYLIAGGIIDWNTQGAVGQISLKKISASGATVWSKKFSQMQSLECNDIVSATNGNYSLCFSETYEGTYGNTQTFIYNLNEAGDILNSTKIDIGAQKYNNALLPLANGGVFALMNAILTPVGFAVPTWNQHNTSFVILNAELTSNSGGFFQTQTNELFTAACKMADGRIACAGVIQPYGEYYYKPALYLLK